MERDTKRRIRSLAVLCVMLFTAPPALSQAIDATTYGSRLLRGEILSSAA